MADMRVVEVNRTRPAERRKQGKSDRLDAYRAPTPYFLVKPVRPPKLASIEPLRSLVVARRLAVKTQQVAMRQIAAVLINAPAAVRDR
jgi:transposase